MIRRLQSDDQQTDKTKTRTLPLRGASEATFPVIIMLHPQL
jgi:hypothetical protein